MVSVRPGQLKQQSVHLRYDHAFDAHRSLYATAHAGQWTSPGTGLFEELAEAMPEVDVAFKSKGASAGFRYAFKDFDTGWGVGAELAVEQRSVEANVLSLTAGDQASMVHVGPRVGWRRSFGPGIAVAVDGGPHLTWTTSSGATGWDGSGVLGLSMRDGEWTTTRGGADLRLRVGFAW